MEERLSYPLRYSMVFKKVLKHHADVTDHIEIVVNGIKNGPLGIPFDLNLEGVFNIIYIMLLKYIF